ncbi:hypothetical protein PSP6_630011 [Paraburkholderia tropica]|nr:hypothetical protein PSP6_630011 [Paraburkholderia tropica]
MADGACARQVFDGARSVVWNRLNRKEGDWSVAYDVRALVGFLVSRRAVFYTRSGSV